MKQHYNVQHAIIRRHRGGNKATPIGLHRERLDREHYGDLPPWIAISFQRFIVLVQVQGVALVFRVRTPSLDACRGNPDMEDRQQLREDIETPGRGSLMAESVFKELADLDAALEYDE